MPHFLDGAAHFAGLIPVLEQGVIGVILGDIQIGSLTDDAGHNLDRCGDGACKDKAQHGKDCNNDEAGGNAGGDGALPHVFQGIQNYVLIHQKAENPVVQV